MSELSCFLAAEVQPSNPLLLPTLANFTEILLVSPQIATLLAHLYSWHIYILSISLTTRTQSHRYMTQLTQKQGKSCVTHGRIYNITR